MNNLNTTIDKIALSEFDVQVPMLPGEDLVRFGCNSKIPRALEPKDVLRLQTQWWKKWVHRSGVYCKTRHSICNYVYIVYIFSIFCGDWKKHSINLFIICTHKQHFITVIKSLICTFWYRCQKLNHSSIYKIICCYKFSKVC